MVRVLHVLMALALLGPLAPPAAAEPTPGLNLSLERIVPEPHETNDFISLGEARAYLDALVQAAPDYVEVLDLAESVGWDSALGGHDTWTSFAVEVTNEASAVPREAKEAVVFQLSIHGNEKGGREGGLRVIEDLAIPRLYGEDYRDLLDTTIVVFTFPNVDGWTHEELAYRTDCPDYFAAPVPNPVSGDGCVESQGFVRYNGHGQDMNRDWPTLGWYNTAFGREHALSEPEMAGMASYLEQFRGRTLAALDIHGMMNPANGGIEFLNTPLGLLDAGTTGEPSFCTGDALPENPVASPGGCIRDGHFILLMIGFGPADARQAAQTVQLGERTVAGLNAMAEERFPYWTSAPNAGLAGGQWSQWATGWDAIGYTDSGTTGRWFPEYLGGAGGTVEMSYNHIVTDNHYVPELNAMHVESVRMLVRGFLDDAAEQVRPTLAPEGTIAYLADERMLHGEPLAEGPHANSTADDAHERGFHANGTQFWQDLARYAPAGSIVPVTADDVAQGRFHGHRTLVLADAAWELVADNPAALDHLRMHLQQGKRLVLTDRALQALEVLGLAAEGSVEGGKAYMGYIQLDHDHALAKDVRGLARQTYDGVSLGFALGSGDDATAPIWTVAADALEGGEAAGWSLAPERASLGSVQVGEGAVVFVGAVLPQPNTTSYRPYGLASYAPTYTGYQLLYNALGIAVQTDPAEDVQPASAPAPDQGRLLPGPGPLLLLGAAAALALARRRATRP